MRLEGAATEEEPVPFSAALVMVLLANGLLRVANAAGGALVGFYLAHLAKIGIHTDAILVGNLGAVTSGAELLLALPMGALADRYAPRMLLLGSAILGALATQILLGRSAYFLNNSDSALASCESRAPERSVHFST